MYARSANREWECDKMMNEQNVTKDIGWQLVNSNPGKKAKVLMGGGRGSFLPEMEPNTYFFSSSELDPAFKLIYSPPPRFESGYPARQADGIQMYRLTQLTQIMRWRSWQCGRFPCLC